MNTMDRRREIYEKVMTRVSRELWQAINEESFEEIAAGAFSETLGEQAANYLYDGIYKNDQDSFISFLKMIKNNAISNTKSMKQFIETFKNHK